MSTANSTKAICLFVLVMIVPAAMIMAEDPSSTRNAQVTASPGNDVVPRPEFRLFERRPASPVSADAQTKAQSNYGIVSTATTAGGMFMCDSGSGVAYVGYGDTGIEATGNGGGGFFADSNDSGFASLGTADRGIEAFGTEAGGIFTDLDSSGYAAVGTAETGIQAHGNFAGGHFVDSDSSGYAYVAFEDNGIFARGNTVGGYFADSDNSGEAYVGFGDVGIFANGDVGISASGSTAGGSFTDSDATGHAYVGYGDVGIQARGNEMGGYFDDADSSGHAYVGYGELGIHASGHTAGGLFDEGDGSGFALVGGDDRGIQASGSSVGGYLWDADNTGRAFVGLGDTGVWAAGHETGGYFEDSDSSGEANVAIGDTGIEAQGNTAGGYFVDSDGSGYAYVGYGGYGIDARGGTGGGYFKDLNSTGWARVGTNDRGIEGFGDNAGGYFDETDSGAWAGVASSTYKINGTGSVNFVQNHPYDRDSVIVYAALEGDEVATYTRGTARLVDGEATVPLGDTFKWVTNPDIGLTTYLTPVGDWSDLYVAERTTDEIVVRSAGGTQDGSFDYIVYGLRIGFEESSIVQEKEREAYIPSMADHRQLYQRRPDLKNYNSLERFKDMRRIVEPKNELDLSRARALRDAVIEFDPAVHGRPGPSRMTEEEISDENKERREGVQGHVPVSAARTDQEKRQTADPSGFGAVIPVDDEGNVYATSFRPSAQDLATVVTVSETVEPGDVLVIDRDNQGTMRRGFEAHDSGVIGVVALNAGVVLGTQPPADGPSASAHQAAVGLAGVVTCNVDATYGAIWAGDLLVTSPTPGHAMRTDAPLPGTMLGKALEPLEEGVGAIRVLVMLR